MRRPGSAGNQILGHENLPHLMDGFHFLLVQGLEVLHIGEVVHTGPGRKASDCLKCGKCEKVCPQHLPIRQLLEDVAKEFEKE